MQLLWRYVNGPAECVNMHTCRGELCLLPRLTADSFPESCPERQGLWKLPAIVKQAAWQQLLLCQHRRVWKYGCRASAEQRPLTQDLVPHAIAAGGCRIFSRLSSLNNLGHCSAIGIIDPGFPRPHAVDSTAILGCWLACIQGAANTAKTQCRLARALLI